MSLVFYYSPMSTSVISHWVLEELGVPYEKVKLAFNTDDMKKPEFLALNPNGKVPTLVHDGTAIFESAAITIHLGENFGVERGLFPAPGPARGEALKWIIWSNVSIGEALARYQHNISDRIPKERHNEKAAEAAKADVERLLGVLDAVLQSKKFLVGDAFSLVDAHVAAFAGYLGASGFEIATWPALDAWMKTCTARAAYGRIMSPDA
jgi:glutathione S-transferase